MISVIVPTFKGSTCIKRAIDSVLVQKKVDYEIIVVDDNEPDSYERERTEQLISQYVNVENFKYIKHHRNKNGSAARNTGIKVAKGEYISFLDDDDWYLPGRLKKCLDIAHEFNADVVYTDVLITKNNIPMDYIVANNNGNLFNHLWLNENLFGTGSNIFIKKSSITLNGYFDEKLPRQQDFDFLLRQFVGGSIAVGLNECLVVKAMNGVNNSVSYEKLKFIKNSLISRYYDQIRSLGSDIENKILIAQHKELLHSACIDKNDNGILEQKQQLKQLGYNLSLKELLSCCILASSMRKCVQELVWRIYSRKVRSQHPNLVEIVKKFN